MTLCSHDFKDDYGVEVCRKCGYRPRGVSAARLAEWIIAGRWRNVAIVGETNSAFAEEVLTRLVGVKAALVVQPTQWHDLIVYLGSRKRCAYRLLRDQIFVEVALV